MTRLLILSYSPIRNDARVRKQVYVRRKPDRRPAQGASAEG